MLFLKKEARADFIFWRLFRPTKCKIISTESCHKPDGNMWTKWAEDIFWKVMAVT